MEARFSLRHRGLARRLRWGGDSTLKFGFTWARPLRFDYPQEIQSAGHLTTHDTSKSSDEPPRASPACDLRPALLTTPATGCRCMPSLLGGHIRHNPSCLSPPPRLWRPCPPCPRASPSPVSPPRFVNNTPAPWLLHPVPFTPHFHRPVKTRLFNRCTHVRIFLASRLSSSPDDATPRGPP